MNQCIHQELGDVSPNKGPSFSHEGEDLGLFHFNEIGAKRSVSINNIIYCKSISNYTLFCLEGDQKIIISKTLKFVQNELPKDHFLRVHASYLINVSKIKSILRKDKWLINLGEALIPVSRMKKKKIKSRLLKY